MAKQSKADCDPQELHRECACRIVITCTTPSEKGEMEVSMEYEGDEMLAAFLLENASQAFDEKMEKKKEISWKS